MSFLKRGLWPRPAPRPSEKRGELGDTPRPPAEEGFAPSALPVVGRPFDRHASAGAPRNSRHNVSELAKKKLTTSPLPRVRYDPERDPQWPSFAELRAQEEEASEATTTLGRSVVLVTGVVVLLAVAMFVWKSPLPPSFAAHLDQFDVDHHSEVAETFVDMVPGDAVVSAQASFVPHLSQRYDIFEFPRITPRSTYVLIDDKRYVPGYDAPAYETCRAKLPSFGFALVRAEDGIELWERTVEDAGRLGSEGCG